MLQNEGKARVRRTHNEAKEHRQEGLLRRELAVRAAAVTPMMLIDVIIVSALTGRSRSTIYRDPKLRALAIRNGARCTRWRAGDVVAYLDAACAAAASEAQTAPLE